MRKSETHSASRQHGFTLVEIMVGLVIGMLATVIIMQVLSVFEAQKRTTTGTADAQTNGNIALYSISRDLQMAGFPLISLGDPKVPDSPYECGEIPAPAMSFGATGFNSIFPITLNDNVNGAGPNDSPSDQITIRYGNASGGGLPTTITGVSGATTVSVLNSMACNKDDTALIMLGALCALTTVSDVIDATSITLVDNSAMAFGAAANGANISCLGRWGEIVYAVSNGNLERNGVPAMTGIVNLQAQYGISLNASSKVVSNWVDATGAWAAPSVDDRKRIKAVRIAVVARNAKREPEEVTQAVAWSGSASNIPPTIALNGDADWKHYRYRVFETVIPLRNVVWAARSFK